MSAIYADIWLPFTTHYGAITEAKKVGQLLRAIDDYEGSGITKLALQIAPHVFVRPGELRHAEWSEIDLDGALWIIPAGKMKMRKARRSPPNWISNGLLRYALRAPLRSPLLQPR